MGSSANVQVTDFDIGPARVTFNTTDIGGTAGDVHVKFKYDLADMKADQYGTTLLDQAIKGLMVTVETEFLQTRDKDLWKLLFPNSTKLTSGSTKAIEFDNQVATRKLSQAAVLTLHPLVEGTTSVDFDWTFYLAAPSEDSEYIHAPANQAKLKIIWNVYLDLSVQTSTVPARMFRVGDTTI